MVPAAAACLLPTAPGFWETVREVLQRIATIWDFQLMEIGGRPLTVGKVTIAVLVLLIGIPIARVVTRRISRRLFTRIGLEPGAAAAFQTLAFYAVVVCLMVFGDSAHGIHPGRWCHCHRRRFRQPEDRQ